MANAEQECDDAYVAIKCVEVENLLTQTTDDSRCYATNDLRNPPVPNDRGKRSRRSDIFNAFAAFFVLSSFLIAVVFVGAEKERRNFLTASSTGWIYKSPKVCGMFDVDGRRSSANQDSLFATFSDDKEAYEDEVSVVHCGECGQCSTVQDISILNDTKDTLTTTSKECAKKALLFGRSAVETCLEQEVGFTAPCQSCWVDNIMCDLKHCSFTCIKSVFLYKEEYNLDDSKELNPCLECDEKMCGREFIECAGANRRRSGVVSDINRDDKSEICHKIDADLRESWVSTSNKHHR